MCFIEKVQVHSLSVYLGEIILKFQITGIHEVLKIKIEDEDLIGNYILVVRELLKSG